MPELPEVETMCRGLAPIVGRRIAAVEFPRSRVRPSPVRPGRTALARRVTGRHVAAVQRRGKRVILELSGPSGSEALWLVVEPRMTGLMLLVDPPSPEHVRLVLTLVPPRGHALRDHGPRDRGPHRLLFWDRRGLGTIRLCDARGLEAACGSRVLGPDGLQVTAADLEARLRSSRRAIKVALLDQRAVAGIGNIYAAEILFRSRIDPRTACRRLHREHWERIAAETRAVLGEAVRLEGSSIGDETYRTVDARVGRFQTRHRVYGRAGQSCHTCGSAIVRMVQAQRATFFCPRCQSRARR
jgi:formamidopyrimidine-DNA glycosylase